MTKGISRLFRSDLFRAAVAAVCAVAVFAVSTLASAQEFVKVDGPTQETVPPMPFLAGAYGFIWVALLVYVFSVARGLGRVKGEIEDLRKRIDSGR